MKRLVFFILFVIISFGAFAHTDDSFYFTVEGYVTDINSDDVFDNFPVIVFPDISDTTNKYTVYTNDEGYYFLTIKMFDSTKVLLTVRGFCDNGWNKYSDTVVANAGIYKKNFSICHDPNWFMQEFVLQGFVIDSTTSQPVENHPVIITNNNISDFSDTYTTDYNGFYTDTFVVNIFDTLKFNISTYSFCDDVLKRVTYSYCEKYQNKAKVDFNICAENNFDWTVKFYHKVYPVSNKVYFSEVSNFTADSVFWDFGDRTFGEGFDVLHQYEGGSYKVKMIAYFDGESKEYIDRVVVGKSFALDGEVFASGHLLNSGYLVAVEGDKNSYSVMDVCKIKNGKFNFDEVLRGDYYFYAIPDFDIDTLYFPKFIGTYPDGNYEWQNVEPYVIDNINNHIVIDLFRNDDVYFGHNSIGFSATKDLIYKYDVVNVVLYDSQNIPLNSIPITSTDFVGFDNLPDGKYSVKVEVPGCFSKPYNFYLNSNVKPNITYYYTDDEIIDYYVGGIDVVETNFEIFPNPFSEKISIKSDKYPLDVEIYNSLGQLIEQKQIQSSEFVLTNDFSEGIYIIVLKNEDEILGRKVIIKK